MQVKITHPTDNETIIVVVATEQELTAIKNHTLAHFQGKLKLPGFREGKTPLSLVEKNVDPASLQSEFLQEALNQLYPQAIRAENIRPVAQPEVSITKFVPFTILEFEAKVATIGAIKLSDYKKLKKPLPEAKVTADDVKEVLKSIQTRLSEKKDVDRPAKSTDQVWIDFAGNDATGQPVKGSKGKDYPLILGSDTFIPGFEDNLIGLSAGESKSFTLTFPKDYGVKSLAGQKVIFEVTVTKVQEVITPKLDDDFAAKAGPFKTLKELETDINQQLLGERKKQVGLDYESELIREITKKSQVSVPKVLIDEQIEQMLRELKQNLTYRGLTYEEYLTQETTTDEKYRNEVLAVEAEERLKAGLVLSEIAEQEKIEVTPEEFEIRMQALKTQYKDPAMQTQLEKPEVRQDIAARMLSEKTVAVLAGYASK